MTTDEPKRPTRFGMALFGAFLTPLLYFFSFGPAWILLSYDCLSHEIFGVCYLPFLWLARHNDLCDEFVGWYMDISIDLAQLVLPPPLH